MADPSFDPGRHVGESVTFRGTARTAAAGAIVSSGGGMPVYVEGLRAWSEELEGRPVEVTGVIRRREAQAPPPPPGGIPRHGLSGQTFVLAGAEWALAED